MTFEHLLKSSIHPPSTQTPRAKIRGRIRPLQAAEAQKMDPRFRRIVRSEFHTRWLKTFVCRWRWRLTSAGPKLKKKKIYITKIIKVQKTYILNFDFCTLGLRQFRQALATVLHIIYINSLKLKESFCTFFTFTQYKVTFIINILRYIF